MLSSFVAMGFRSVLQSKIYVRAWSFAPNTVFDGHFFLLMCRVTLRSRVFGLRRSKIPNVRNLTVTVRVVHGQQ